MPRFYALEAAKVSSGKDAFFGVRSLGLRFSNSRGLRDAPALSFRPTRERRVQQARLLYQN